MEDNKFNEGSVILTGEFTQEELVCYFNISKPSICPTHNKPATLFCKDGIVKLNICCCELLTLVRVQIAEQITMKGHEQ